MTLSPARAVIAAAIALVVCATPSSSQSPPSHTPTSAAAPRPGSMPTLRFIENIGQWPAASRFQGRFGSTTVSFEPDGVSYAHLVDSAGTSSLRRLRTTFVGARRGLRPVAAGSAAGHFNYYLGEGRRFVGARSYERVHYPEIYHRIDLDYYGADEGLKYDFTLQPGASSDAIRLRYEGTRSVEIDADGGLRLTTAFGELHEAPPYSYQEIGGRRVVVPSRFRLNDDGSVGFAVGSYDGRHPLVIDPCFSIEYATYFGGGGYDEVTSMAIDSAGNAYASGFTRAPDFPLVPEKPLDGMNYIFLSKIAPDGSSILYSTVVATPYREHYAGNPGKGASLLYESIGSDVEVTATGNAVVAMSTRIDSLPSTTGAVQRFLSPPAPPTVCAPRTEANTDLYIASFGPTGQIRWGTYYGGGGDDYVADIALTASGDVAIAGMTHAYICLAGTEPSTFPKVGSGTALTSSDPRRGLDAFALILAADGRSIRFSSPYGGSADDVASRISVTSSGDLLMLGSTRSNNLPTTPSGWQPTRPTGATSTTADLFLARINPTSGTLAYGTYIGDDAVAGRPGLGLGLFQPGDQGKMVVGFLRRIRPQGLLIDGGRVLIGGTTRSSGLPGRGAGFQKGLHNAGAGDSSAYDAFILAFEEGRGVTAGTYLGGNRFDAFGGMTFDRFGDLVVGVATSSPDFPITPINVQQTLRGDADAGIVALSPDLARQTYGTFYGGGARNGSSLHEQTVEGVVADPEGGIYVFGLITSSDMPLTGKPLSRANDYAGGYILKLAAPTAPKIGAPINLTFGADACGTPIEKSILIFNSGQSPMRIDTLAFATGTIFSLVDAPPTPFTLAPCDTLRVRVQFDGSQVDCRKNASDRLIIVAPEAQQSRVEIPVGGSRICLQLTIQGTSLDSRYRFGSDKLVGFPMYANATQNQYVSIISDPTNQGWFVPLYPDSLVVAPGSSSIPFRVNVPDTGRYCERFTAIIEPCGRVVPLEICLNVVRGIFEVDAPIDLGLISCREITQPIEVRNVGNDSLIVRIAYVAGSSDIEVGANAVRPTNIPAKSSHIFTVDLRPKGTGAREATIVFHTDEGTDDGTDRLVPMRYELDSVAFRLEAQGATGGFGDIVEMPIRYVPILEGRLPIEELTLAVTFDRSLLDLVGAGFAGTAMEGWDVVRILPSDSGGIIVLRRGESAQGIRGPSEIGRLRFRVLRGDTVTSPFDIALGGVSAGCFTAVTDSNRLFQLSAECRTGDRLLFEGRRLLRSITPNPVAETATLRLTLHEEAQVSVVLYDAGGAEVARPIDVTLPPGEASLPLETRDLPAGLYFCRLTIGPYLTETTTLMVVR